MLQSETDGKRSSAYQSSALKLEATCFSETSANFLRNTPLCVPENINFHNHGCMNLKSYVAMLLCDHSAT
jgi:hypothetical protein